MQINLEKKNDCIICFTYFLPNSSQNCKNKNNYEETVSHKLSQVEMSKLHDFKWFI